MALTMGSYNGQVPGTLLVAGNSLHFVETHARVGPEQFLALRALKVTPPFAHNNNDSQFNTPPADSLSKVAYA